MLYRSALVIGLFATIASPVMAQEQNPVKFLKQGWSDEERQDYYYRPQGSKLLPYDWMLALEEPYSTRPFLNDANIRSFRFLPNEKNKFNPDGLPVGFTKSIREGKAWFGLSCAACHTGQFSYRGMTVQIDGGPGLQDIMLFQQSVTAAVRATVYDDEKFQRFAGHILKGANNDAAEKRLRADLTQWLGWLEDWAARSRPVHPNGFGRWDAIHVAFNDVTAIAIDEPQNFRTPLAPVSYPCIWLTPSLESVLWNGSVVNTLSRSIGEAIIVFGRFNFTSDLKFNSSVSVPELEAMYRALYDLQPPAWPEEILGKIDQEKAARGAKIYVREKCDQCHANKPPYPMTPPNSYGYSFIKITQTPLKEIGTDPVYVESFLSREAIPGMAAPMFKGTVFENAQELPAAILFLNALKNFTQFELDRMHLSAQQQLKIQDGRASIAVPTTAQEVQAVTEQLTAYKTQPLAGIWATAPYLHNGSVPNLYQLLLPPEQRVKVFYVGSREYDPKHVGYESAPSPDAFRFDTSVLGNSNSGHNYGTSITDEERWNLIEYLKTL